MFTYQGCLFAKVGSIAGNYKLAGNMTFPLFTSQAVNLAVARAQAALLQD